MKGIYRAIKLIEKSAEDRGYRKGVEDALNKETIDNIRRIRNYFGENDKTLFEHWAYSFLDSILNLKEELLK
jgi:hypothetical protein